MTKPHSKQWFYNRIGKRISRGKVSCQCATCEDVGNNGLIVIDKFHADYLHMVQYDLEIEYVARKKK